MPLDGLRAWIGEVERKLGMRTRVFLVLATIAIGGAGAAVYLAIDTREDAVSESDVRELQERLEAQIAENRASAPAPAPAPESVEPPGQQPEPAPKPEPEPESKSGQKEDTGSGAEAAPDAEAAKGKLRDLLEEAKKQRDESE
jgi:hypothetical protein